MKAISTFLAADKVFGKLRTLSTTRAVDAGTVLFRQGESPKEVILVLRGDVALTPAPTEPTLCWIAGPGSVLGLPANLSGKAYSLTALAGDSCEIASLPRKQFLEAIRRDSEVALGIVQILAHEVSRMQNAGMQFRLANVYELNANNTKRRTDTETWPT